MTKIIAIGRNPSKWLWLCCCLWGISCAGTPSSPQQQAVPDNVPQTKAEQNALPEQHSPVESQKTPAGSPMASAVQTMQTTEQEMADAVKFAQKVQAGNITLDPLRERERCFRTLQAFFSQRYFSYDAHNFWFWTATGLKIGVKETDGILRKCTYGLFAHYKQLVTVQYNGNSKIRTEFYVDEATNDLMVHRYRGNHGKNENFQLKQ